MSNLSLKKVKSLHPDFQFLLAKKEPSLVELFLDCRAFMLEQHRDCNELFYHTHALTTVFSLSDKLTNAYCHLPIYTKHFNLGFNQGSLLPDPQGLLRGTGKWIRYIEIKRKSDYRNPAVMALVDSAVRMALSDMDQPPTVIGQSISKIKE